MSIIKLCFNLTLIRFETSILIIQFSEVFENDLRNPELLSTGNMTLQRRPESLHNIQHTMINNRATQIDLFSEFFH